MKKSIIVFILGLSMVLCGCSDQSARTSAIESSANTADLKLLEMESAEDTDAESAASNETEDGVIRNYYYGLLTPSQQSVYNEMLENIQNRVVSFQISMAADDNVEFVYHALLNDHPELFWIDNREQVYTTSYPGQDTCLFAPGYTYTDEEVAEVQQASENAYQSVISLIVDGADDYEKVRVVYEYLIDNMEYISSDDDQNIAGAFWKGQAVCAGYARAMQYLLGRLDVSCIYVEGDTRGSDEGHAWNIVYLDGQYYYVDATNADQPQFLEGDAVQLAEHKTILYDYLCPFPQEYELMYTPSDTFFLPSCTATDLNFYVLNDGCFDYYDSSTIYDYCCMRIDYGAAVIRFKFSDETAFESALSEWIDSNSMDSVAQYYMNVYGLSTVQYHYGVLEDLKTIYFIF